MYTLLPMLWSVMLATVAPVSALTGSPSLLTPPPPAVEIAPAPVSTFVPETLGTGFATERAAFEVRFAEQRVSYRTMGVFSLPGDEVAIEVVDAGDHDYELVASTGTIVAAGPHRWIWTAPSEVGSGALRVLRRDGETVSLNAFVMVPYSEMKQGKVRGYSVGSYPAPRNPHSSRPVGFVEVTPTTANLQVAPHFRLSQFICKAGAGYPKYVVVQPNLLLRLEGLLETVNRNGVPAHTFELMSAYRTPSYNKGIGNETTFSRHQYGDAADIYVDHFPADGVMDDLNRDGRFDRKDAMTLHRWAEETEGEQPSGVAGGLSAYSANAAHGPFVHVDTRGYRARW